MGLLKKFIEPVDMTEGSPWQKIVLFAVPMLVGNIAQQLYNTVDSVVVGNYVGDNALAAVGSAGPILNLLIVLFVGISVGAGIMVSQYFGAKEREKLSTTIGNCITLTGIATLFVMIVASLVARPLLELLDTPESIIGWCQSYLLILFIGSGGLAFYNILSGVLRGLGDSMSALIYLLVSTLVNIVLDLLFVAKLGMGVNGVALATVIAQAISALLCLLRLMRMQELFELKPCYLKLQRKYTRKIIKLGLPSGITQAIFSMAMIVVQSLTNSFGEMFIAANVIVMRVDGFARQNVGARRDDRVDTGAKQGTLIAVVISAAITSLILIFGKALMGIFTKTPELVDLSRDMMGILAVGYVAMAVTQSLSGVMRGAGDTMTPMWISIATTILIRVPIAYGISFLTRTAELPNGRQECIFISLLASWLIGALITYIFYRRGKWKEKAI